MSGEVASLEELQAFERAAPESKEITPSLKGILIEIANTGVLRYDWKHLQSLILHFIDQVILEYDVQSQVEIGPARPVREWETADIMRQKLKGNLADQFPTEAPFTIQRLAELLLEPHKHYTRLKKLVFALEKLILVTSTLPTSSDPGPPPKLSDLGPVNCNPKPVDMMFKATRPDGHHNPASGPGEGGYGLASSFLAVNSAGHPEDRPELEEAMGHLNEAGMAADVASKHPPEVPQPDMQMDDTPSSLNDLPFSGRQHNGNHYIPADAPQRPLTPGLVGPSEPPQRPATPGPVNPSEQSKLQQQSSDSVPFRQVSQTNGHALQ